MKTPPRSTALPFSFFLPFLLAISALSLLNTFVRTIFSPLIPYICRDLQLCHGDAGRLFLILSTGFACTLFGAQFISTRFTHRITIILSLFMTGASLLLAAHSVTFTALKSSLFLLGLSSGFFIPSAVAIIREVVASAYLGKAFGIFGSAQSAAFLLSSLVTESCIHSMRWQTLIGALGFGCFFMTAIAAFWLKEGQKKSAMVTRIFARSLFNSPSFWIVRHEKLS